MRLKHFVVTGVLTFVGLTPSAAATATAYARNASATFVSASPVVRSSLSSIPTSSASLPASATGEVTTTSNAASPVIDGFRAAKFGMAEDEVRKAIMADFHLSASEIHTSQDQITRTGAFGITVQDLFSGAGKAGIGYVFGYSGHKLIEVNIVWSAPDNSPEMLTRIGAQLQSYFENEGFLPGQSAANVVLHDGSVILFRAMDGSGHAVVLTLAGRITDNQKSHQSILTPTMLTLAYVANPAHPDVYSIPKGAF